MLENQNQSNTEDDDEDLKNAGDYKVEGKIFRHSKLYSNYRQEKMSNDNEISEIEPPTTLDLGKQLLMYVRVGDYEKVHELLSKGAPFSTDWLGMSALHFAVINNHKKICDLLLRGGIGKDGRTKADRTPLHFAVYHGHEAIVRLLLERKCDVNARDMLRMTSLHWAVEKGFKSIARLLLKYGADVSYISKFNKTPIVMAIEKGHLDLADELNIAKEQQKLEESLMNAVQVQAETNQAIKSISSGNKNPSEYMDIDDEESNDASKTILNGSSESKLDNKNNIKKSDSDDEDEEIKYIEPIIQSDHISEESEDENESSVLEILKSHGISMLPHDDPAASLISSALNSGRKLVLSEAGKLVLNETKLKQNNIDKMKNTSIKKPKINTITKIIPKKQSDDNKKPLSAIVKAKGLDGNQKKNIKVISVSTLKKVYGDDILDSLKKLKQRKGGTQLITKITKVPKKSSDDDNNENKEIKILNKEYCEKLTSSEEMINDNIMDDNLPPNIEICLESESENDNSNMSCSFNEQPEKSLNQTDENNSSDEIKDHNLNENQLITKSNNIKDYLKKTMTSVSGSLPKSSLIIKTLPTAASTPTVTPSTSKSLMINKPEIIIQKGNDLSRKLSIIKVPSNIKKEKNIIQLMDIPEICHQLYELKKQVEELKKTNEEYRLRIEKLENDRTK